MAAGLPGSARTTPRVRAELQAAQGASGALAARHGPNPKTVAKWRKRATTADLPLGGPCPPSLAGTEDRRCRCHPGGGRDRLSEEVSALGRGGAAVQRRGAAGQVENSQVGVFLAYGSRRGHALVDRGHALVDRGHALVDRRRRVRL